MDQEEENSASLTYNNASSNTQTQIDLDQQTSTQTKNLLKYSKRPGTAGINGHFYETKLLCLVLSRASLNKEIEEFYLATNVDKIGNIDDLVLRYKLKGQDKPKIIFLQAKHTDNPYKQKLTVDRLFIEGDFSLHEAFYSYCLIRQKLNDESGNGNEEEKLFQGNFDSVDCEFIIYTSKNEKFNRKKFPRQEHITSEDDMLYTKNDGSTFQFDYENEDIEKIISNATKPEQVNVGMENIKSWVEDFFCRLKFYTNQAKQDLVENLVKESIAINYNKNEQEKWFRIETHAIFLKVHDKIQSWWKKPGPKGTCLTKSCDYFMKAKTEIAESPLLDILNCICTLTIQKPDIVFRDDIIQALELHNVLKTDTQVTAIVSSETALSCIKILHHFKEKMREGLYLDYKFIDLTGLPLGFNLADIISELNKTKPNVIIVVCIGYESYERFQYIHDHVSQKIIIITNDISYNEYKSNLPTVHTEITDEKNSLTDLSSESQKSLKDRRIKFQGQELTLGTVLDEKSKLLVHSEVLVSIANYESVEFGNIPSTLNDSVEGIHDCYIQRSISHHIELQCNYYSLKENFYYIDETQSEVDIKENKDIILVSDELEKFEATLLKYRDHNVHWFKKESDKIVWKKSRGKVERLFGHVTRAQDPSYSLKPITVKDIDEELVIIIGEPGMGKSSLLRKLSYETKQKYPNMWIMLINLREHGKIFSKWAEDNIEINEIEAVKFLCNASSFQVCKMNDKHISTKISTKSNQNKNNPFEILINKQSKIALENKGKIKGQALLELELFIHLYNQGNVVILLDGLDESVDYEKEVIALIHVLKAGKLNSVWITSRNYNICNELEKQLGTFSYVLDSLTSDEQKEYLKSYWKIHVEPGKFENVDSFIDGIYRYISDINQRGKEFTGIPLHLYMIAEVFTEENNQSKLNLIFLYEYFIKKKCKIYEDKVLNPDFATKSGGRRIIKLLRSDFLENHKKMGTFIIFGYSALEELFSKEDLSELKDYINILRQDGESTGIVERVRRNEPVFIHLSYAEYFASEYVFDQLKSAFVNKSTQEFILKILLINSGLKEVRRFFNSKLEQSDEMESLTSLEHITSYVFSEIMKVKFDIRHHVQKNPFPFLRYPFIDSIEDHVKQPAYAKALCIAGLEGLDNVTRFVVNCVECHLNKDSFEEFHEQLKQVKNLVHTLKEAVMHPFSQSSNFIMLPYFSPKLSPYLIPPHWKYAAVYDPPLSSDEE